MKTLFRRIKFLIGLFLSGIIILLISGLINLTLESIPILNNLQTSILDFRITDIGYQKIWKSEEKRKDIILVNFKQTSRDTIGLVLQRIAEFKPRVVGIDAFFTNPLDGYSDSLLILGISSNLNVVLPCRPQDLSEIGIFQSVHTSDSSFINIGNVSQGQNLLYGFDILSFIYGAEQNNVIRSYQKVEQINKRNVFNFGLEILRAYDSVKFADRMLRRLFIESGSGEMEIKYKSGYDGFVILDYMDILTNNKLQLITDQIVIVGYLGVDEDTGNYRNIENRHVTPLNSKIVGDKSPDMYGTLIHANILAMYMDSDFISNISYGQGYIFFIHFAIYFLIFSTLIILFKKYGKTFYLRYTSYGIIVFLGLLENLLYFKFDIYFDSRPFILDLILLPELINIYYGKLMPFINKHKADKEFPFFVRIPNSEVSKHGDLRDKPEDDA